MLMPFWHIIHFGVSSVVIMQSKHVSYLLTYHDNRHDDDGCHPFDIDHATMFTIADGKVTQTTPTTTPAIAE